MIVTDKKYYLDKYAVENLMGIKQHLKDRWDCVGIYSGHGKVRIGKTTKASQDGYFLAWQNAGGEMEIYYEVCPDGKRRKKIREKCPNKVPVRFGLENYAFTPEDLIEKATKLPPNSVIIYDEGRKGLDSRRMMESINRMMEDFFQTCGQYYHVLLIVLPDFFKLHEDYAISRSLYLVDCYAVPKGKRMVRGYFRFYNERKKEWLYKLGKKKYITTNRYAAVESNFWGRFTKFFPVNLDEYEKLKKYTLEKYAIKKEGKLQKRFKAQRDACIYLLCELTNRTQEFLARHMGEVSKIPITEQEFCSIRKEVEERWLVEATQPKPTPISAQN